MSLWSTLRFIAQHPLNRHRKARALLDFVRWQLGMRLLKSESVHHWINGARFIVRRGETGLSGNVYTGLHEFPDMAFLLHFLRADDGFADIGANVGSYTVLAGAAVGSSVLSFEPVPSTFARLQRNVRINALERVHCVNQAISDHAGTLQFAQHEDTTNRVVDSDYADAILVPTTTLDAALSQTKFETPALIKIDVEGFETAVIAGARATLAEPKLKAIIMELNGSGARYGFDEAALFQRMCDAGFQPFSYDPLQRRLLPLPNKNSDHGNTLFLRDLAFIEARLRSAAHIEIHGLSI